MKPTGARGEVTLWQKLVPWGEDGRPVLLGVAGTSQLYLPLFSKRRQLHSFMVGAGIAYAKVKEITEPREFLASIPDAVALAVDPRLMSEGKVRWLQVTFEDAREYEETES